MKQKITVMFVALTVAAAHAARAAPPARSMYNDALAHEQAVRQMLDDSGDGPTALNGVRAVTAAYEAIVKHYPASGYSDNALWQAAVLELDAFEYFGEAQDQDTAVRLLQKLAAAYPSSSLVAGVADQLARAGLTSASTTSREIAASLRLATIKDIRRAVLPDVVRLTIELDGEVPFHDERIPDPTRVFVDLPGTRAAPALVDQTLRFDGDTDLIHQVRIGRHPNHTTRVVLDAAGVTSYSIYPLYSPFRIVIDCIRPVAATTGATTVATSGPVRAPATPSTPAAAPPPLPPVRAKRPNNDWGRRLPSVSPQASALIAVARAVAEVTSGLEPPIVDTPSPVSANPAAPPPPPARNTTGGFSISRQLGLGVSRIVIDAGHGGHDPGAKGKGVTEAELVLDVALRLEKLLQKIPGVEVILTRRTDDFLPLPERTAIANREGADLFLSIHANASPSGQARGVETYFLNFANNLSAAAVAARENAASGQAMGALPDLVKTIALNNKLDESRDFAAHVQHAMIERLRGANKTVKDLGVKQAPFVVLIGAAMPSVLAEISFVTNPQEAKLLKGNPYRQRIAEALFTAIRKYQTSLKNVTTVAQQ